MNRFFTLLLAASYLTAVGQVPDYVPTDGLVAWYPLSESGEDASGNGHDLIQVGAPIWTIDDAGAHCDFDGEGTHFYHPQALFPEVSELTISLWTRIDALSSGSNVGVIRPIISKHYSSSNGSFILHPFEDGIQAWQFSAPYPIELGTWYHFTYVVSEVSKLYIDGELVNSADSPTNGWNPTDHPFMIGGWLNSPWWSNNWSNTALTFDGGMSSVGLWSRELSQDEISQLLDPVLGCMHEQACNYNEFASTDDGTCDFVSCHCLTGTVWDEDLGGCIGDGSGDINLDGCVQLNDLLDLLSAYGGCEAEASPWLCGDPLEYQGYDYATVQIGEQCWFAENLRAENDRDGEPIDSIVDDDEWTSTSIGAWCSLGVEHRAAFGLLYNGHAVFMETGLCPSGWDVPSKEEWQSLSSLAGGEAVAGLALKSTSGWPIESNGNDTLGFTGLPAGTRNHDTGLFAEVGTHAYFHSSTSSGSEQAWRQKLFPDANNLGGSNRNLNHGFSVRCLKNAE